jgi:hypothetical protein
MEVMTSAQPFPDEDGRYHPASENPDDPLYTGVFENESVYIVGFGTDNEKFFPRGKRVEAFNAAQDGRLTIDHLRACGLAEGLMVKLFGA